MDAVIPPCKFESGWPKYSRYWSAPIQALIELTSKPNRAPPIVPKAARTSSVSVAHCQYGQWQTYRRCWKFDTWLVAAIPSAMLGPGYINIQVPPGQAIPPMRRPCGVRGMWKPNQGPSGVPKRGGNIQHQSVYCMGLRFIPINRCIPIGGFSRRPLNTRYINRKKRLNIN